MTKKIHVNDLTKKGFKYKIVALGDDAVIPPELQTTFDTLEEAMLKSEEYVITGQITGVATRIKEVAIN